MNVSSETLARWADAMHEGAKWCRNETTEQDLLRFEKELRALYLQAVREETAGGSLMPLDEAAP